MIDLVEAQKLYERALSKLAMFTPSEVHAAVMMLGLLIDEHRDALAAVKAPELHWECKQREGKLEEEVRSARDRLGQVADSMNYSLPGGRRPGMTKPITPSEVDSKKEAHIPPQIIEAANELIAKHWSGDASVFTLREMVALAHSKLDPADSRVPFNSEQMDIEPVFRLAGWLVEFDKPGYCESYDAHFTFRKKRSR